MKFFYGCTTEKEAKDIYRKLAKCFHPDKGGSSELMKELKEQYDKWDEPVIAGEYRSQAFTPNNFGNYGIFNRFNPDSLELDSVKERNRSLEYTIQVMKCSSDSLHKELSNRTYENRKLQDQIKDLKNELKISKFTIESYTKNKFFKILQYFKLV